MAKILRKALKNRNARRNACIELRSHVTNPKIPAELAFKMPGSMQK